jgi:hypothetical protein
MEKPSEILLYEFLRESFNALPQDHPLFEVELHDTVFQTIKTERGVRISEAVGDLSPGPEMVVKEYDVLVILTCYSRVTGKEKTDRQPALIDVFAIQKAVYSLLIDDSTLGGRVCDSMLLKGGRGYDVLEGEPYAVSNTPIVINPSGETLAGRSYS